MRSLNQELGSYGDSLVLPRQLHHTKAPTRACSHFSCALLFATLWTVAPRLLCRWDSLGKNTGVGVRALIQGIFPNQGSNPHLSCLPTLAGGFFITKATWEDHQCPTTSNWFLIRNCNKVFRR